MIHEPYRRLQQFVGRTVLLCLARCAHLIPAWAVDPTVVVLGRWAMLMSPRHRRIVADNLRTAFGREKSDLERRVIARRFYRNFAKSVIEFLRLPATSAEEIIRTNQLQGKHYIDEALEAGHGVILITAHYGNWETMGARLALAGYRPLNVIVRDQRDRAVTQLLTTLRVHGGLNVITRERAMLQCMRLLRGNRMVAMLIDQNAGDSGVFVEFFGKLASTAGGAAVLARRTSAAVIPAFSVRQPDGTLVAEIGPPIAVQRTDDAQADVIANTAAFTKVVEAAVRRHPDHWFWLHRRWKARPPWERVANKG